MHREPGVLGVLVIETGYHFYTMPDVFSEKLDFQKKYIELLWKILNEIKFCLKKDDVYCVKVSVLAVFLVRFFPHLD